MRRAILLCSTVLVGCQGGAGSDPTPIDGATQPDLDGGLSVDGAGAPDASSPDAAPALDAPTVTATSPASGATDVAPDVDLVVMFSSDLAPASVTAATFLVTRDGTPVAGSVDATARTATFAPVAPLTLDGVYTATVTTGVTGATGVPLDAAMTWSFTVRDGAWTAATRIDAVGDGEAATPIAAADALGNVTVVWPEARELYAVRFQPGAGWSAGTNLSTEDGTIADPAVAAAPGGDVVVLWAQARVDHADIVARTFTSGAWTPTATLDPDDVHYAELPDVAFSGAGDAMAVWSRWNGEGHQLWASHLADGWSAPTLLADAVGEIYDRHPPSLAGGDDGFTMIVGRGSNPNTWFNRYAAGAWGTTAVVPLTQDLWTYAGDVGAAGDGTVTTAWSRHPNGVEGYVDAVRLVGGVWSQERLDAADGDGESAFSPQLAVAPSGEVVAIWHQADAGPPRHVRLWASRFVPDSGWTAPALISGADFDVWASDVAITDDGRAFAIWTEEPSATYVPQVHAASQSPGGAWQDGVQLSTGAKAGQPSVIADSTGAITMTWWQSATSSGASEIWAARFE